MASANGKPRRALKRKDAERAPTMKGWQSAEEVIAEAKQRAAKREERRERQARKWVIYE